ncbi:UNVERIFIED_ORG: hypothetical protein FHW05_000295 [Pantoea agglomerans]
MKKLKKSQLNEQGDVKAANDSTAYYNAQMSVYFRE